MSVKSCSIKLVCLTALLCLSVSPVALFYICVTFIRSYTTTARYVPMTCSVTETNVTSGTALCQCAVDSGSCDSHGACVRLIVHYAPPVLGKEHALLYETHSQKEQLTEAVNTTCSYYVCLNVSRDITSDYDLIGHDIISPRGDILQEQRTENFTCFVDPEDPDHALRTVPQKGDIIFALIAPLCGVFLGICFCIVAKVCTRHKD